MLMMVIVMHWIASVKHACACAAAAVVIVDDVVEIQVDFCRILVGLRQCY